MFAELGQIKLSETDVDGICERIVDLARRSLPNADEASVTIVRDGSARSAAADERARRLDELQYDQLGGPSLLAATENVAVRVTDTTEDDRWEGWAAVAASLDIHSVLSVGLAIADTVTGAITLYSETPDAFPGETVALAQVFARYAAVALANAHLYDTTASLAEHMRRAMEHRAVIEQAKGIIMAERRCTPEQAFTILTRLSQDSNRKLRDVATALVGRHSRAEALTSAPRRGPTRTSG
jgi:GAF domain-containing protein